MTLNIEYETEIRLTWNYEELLSKVVEEAAAYEGCPYETEINILLTDNSFIRCLNREHRGIDAPTDVLSFPMIAYEAPAGFQALESRMNAAPQDYFNPDSGELMLGDIVISVEKVKEQAEAYGHSQERELAFLTAHSMLHLFGYDHMEQDEAAVMEHKQEEILDRLGIRR